jgi:hypothetical protein
MNLSNQKRNAGAVGYAFRRHKGQQRQNAAFAIVIGAQNEDDVFERDHRHQRPEDQRHHPKDIGSSRRGMAGGIQGDRKGVERARADIAEHDAKRGEREEPAAPFMGQLAGVRPLGAWQGIRGAANGSVHEGIIPPKTKAPGRGGLKCPARFRLPTRAGVMAGG